MAVNKISRYSYTNTPQYSVLGANAEQQLGPQNIDWNNFIQTLYQNLNINPTTSGVNNTHRLQSSTDGSIKPLYDVDDNPTNVDRLKDTTGQLIDEYNPDKVKSMVQQGKQMYNKIKPLFANTTTTETPKPSYTAEQLAALDAKMNYNPGLAYDATNLGTTASSASSLGNVNYSAPVNDMSYLNDFQQVTQNPNGGEAISQAGSSASNFNWGQAANIGAGIAATAIKKAYNAYAPDLYTKDVDNDYEKLAYNDIYGKTNEDPLQRASVALYSNEDRMEHSINTLKSNVRDYSNMHNNDESFTNVYDDTLDNLKPIEYESYGKDNYKFLAPLAVGFLPPGIASTALATMPAWGTKSKRAQDLNSAAFQGAMAGTSYGGLGWGTLGGTFLGVLANTITGFGAKERTKMYNEALEKAKKANVENYYNTADRNLRNEILDMQRNTYKSSNGGFLGKFDNGGSLDGLNGITEFNVGGSHEQNPYDGIQQGIASDGNPNLVEEGEVKYKDYIYSARLKPSKSLLKEFNLPEKYSGKTFAELADILQKESEDRPNDPVSLQTLNDWMSRLAGAQEEYKTRAVERKLAKTLDNMSIEDKAAIMSSLAQPMMQEQEGIDLSQPMYKSGGKIYIKPSKRGTFTAAAKKRGMGVQEFASKVLANKENYSPAMVKKANFARNFGGHKHEDGGHLFDDGGFPETFEDYMKLRSLLNSDLGVTVGDYQANRLQPGFQIEPLLTEDDTAPFKYKVTPKSTTATPDGTASDGTVVTTNNSNGFDGSMLRYAPAVGAGLGALTALMQRKDYYLADALRDISRQYKPMGAPHIGGKRKPKTYDVNLGDAENLALLASTLRANRSNANRGQQTAGAIGIINAFEKQNALRNLAQQQAQEAEDLEVAKYNLGIDQFNAQQDAAADRLNAEINNRRIAALMSAAQAEDTANSLWKQNVSGTTENFFNQLGNVGRDEWNRNQMLNYLRALGYEGIV